MFKVKAMTKPVVFKPSGKCLGIKGLYKSPLTGRLYVRYSFHGIDKQVSIFPKNHTFSELERTAKQALNELKKKVKASIQVEPKTGVERRLTLFERASKDLEATIKEVWARRGVSQKHIDLLLHATAKMCLCSSKRSHEISAIEHHNDKLVQDLMADRALTPGRRKKFHEAITSAFSLLIQSGLHFGKNPGLAAPPPKVIERRKTGELDFEAAARVLGFIQNKDHIVEAEIKLFFRLCVETGQRPSDIHRFEISNLNGNHYTFSSHKTQKLQRISHLLSPDALNEIGSILRQRKGVSSFEIIRKNKYASPEVYLSFFERAPETCMNAINRAIRAAGLGKEITIYSARHFFISEIFRETGSEFWASAFTHEGVNVNQKHYLHPDQDEADSILKKFCARFQSALARSNSN